MPDIKSKKRIAIMLAAVIFIIAVSLLVFGGGKAEIASTVTHDTKHNGAITGITREELEKKGFRLGDSCDVIFGSGYSLENVPLLSGYYVKEGEPVTVSYSDRDMLVITLRNIGIWDEAGLTEGETVTLRLNRRGGYSALEEAFDLKYSNDRADYGSDEEFCNFRALRGGNLKEDFLFRGASPINDETGRAALTDRLISGKGIAFDLNLSESEEDIEALIAENGALSPHAVSLYENGRFAALDLGSDYRGEEYRRSIAEGLRKMMKAEGPVYIHCVEGKDRTGFVCVLLEALAGATYDEMLDDYMMTYSNYYSVDESSAPEKYGAIAELYFEEFIGILQGTDSGDNADYSDDAARYLISGGMTEDEIKALTAFLVKE